jgi:L-threonine-O-3-phosphate decarboxylase
VSGSEVHGGVRPAELAAAGLRPEDVVDFSVNVSPLGLPAGVHEALAGIDLTAYPDPDCTLLTQALAKTLDVPPDRILAGNGSTELIHLVTRLFVHRGQRPVALAPTFSEFPAAVALAGGNIYPWQAQPQRGFRWNLKNKPDVLRRVAPPLVYLCNPNNPTGVYLGRDEVRGLAAALTAGPLLLDEAYVNFVDEPWRSLDLVESGRVVVVRSMTKDYALAGLRLGYLVAHPDVVQAVRRLQPAWSVSAAAQAAGAAALADQEYLSRMRTLVREAKQVLVDGLRRLGLHLQEGSANFVMVELGDAGAVRAQLLQSGLLVRSCASFGLPSWIRIGVRRPEECRRLVRALEVVLGEQPATANGKVASGRADAPLADAPR